MTSIREVEFHGQQIPMLEHDHAPHVAMRPIVDALNLDWKSQHKKITEHPVLGSVVVMSTTTGSDGKRYEMLALPLEYLNGWLFGVDTRRVKPELRERLLTYQRECFAVLHRHWHGEPTPESAQAVPALPPSVDHRADHIVSATRVFNGLLRSGQSMRLNRARAVQAANAAARDATGYDICAAMGVTEEDLASERRGLTYTPRRQGDDNDEWLPLVAEWLAGRERATSWEALQAVGKSTTNANAGDLMRVAACMQRCGWRKKRERVPGRPPAQQFQWVWRPEVTA